MDFSQIQSSKAPFNSSEKPDVRAAYGWSPAPSPEAAFADIFGDMDVASAACALVYVSPKQDLHETACAIQQTFNGPVVACTTAGEIVTGRGYMEGGIAAAAIWGVDASVAVIKDLDRFDASAASSAVRGLNPADETHPHSVAVLLVDGLAMCEERVSSYLHEALSGVSLVGGSAGDEGRFERTLVYDGDQFREGIGTLLKINSPYPVQIGAHQHFKPTDKRLVITDADPSARLIREFNGRNAAEAYAEAVGVDQALVDAQLFCKHPLIISTPAGQFVRAIQSVDALGHVKLYCAIEDGVIVSLGEQMDLRAELQTELDALHSDETALVLGFDCILRRIEAATTGNLESLAGSLGDCPFIGFSTYGEQINGLHVNQTLTYAVLRKSA